MKTVILSEEKEGMLSFGERSESENFLNLLTLYKNERNGSAAKRHKTRNAGGFYTEAASADRRAHRRSGEKHIDEIAVASAWDKDHDRRPAGGKGSGNTRFGNGLKEDDWKLRFE